MTESTPSPPPDSDGVESSRDVDAPALPYRPRDPRSYRPAIGLIGCGGISGDHLAAYRAAGYRVTALCDLDSERAAKRKSEYYPRAEVFTDYRELLRRGEIEVVDIALHPEHRGEIVRDALSAGKHVLSQKPFVLDLDEGERLVELAERRGVRLAVNQNARWAPHFSWLREAVAAGLLGRLHSATAAVHWDHNWVGGTPFDQVKHLILFDFGIHWFDFLVSIFPASPAERVYATTARAAGQEAKRPLLAQAVVEFDGAQAALLFNGNTRRGRRDTTLLAGERGTAESRGADHNRQRVELASVEGIARPLLAGRWFPDGFHGTMGELLCSIEQQRPSPIDARENLKSLELCFAACAAADRGHPVVPGSVRRIGTG